MEIKLISPVQCSNEEIQSFCRLVLEGDQVPGDGLAERIKICQLLGFAYEGKELIAVTAVKNPNEQYKHGVFTKAGVPNLSSKYPYEIGYAFTKKAYRGKGIHQQLVTALIKESGATHFYGTTKSANVPYILEKIGFAKTGKDYQNDEKEVLQLFTFGEAQ